MIDINLSKVGSTSADSAEDHIRKPIPVKVNREQAFSKILNFIRVGRIIGELGKVTDAAFQEEVNAALLISYTKSLQIEFLGFVNAMVMVPV